MIWDHLDRGTFDAILRLYRSAPSPSWRGSGATSGSIEAPALVVWGLRDRYLPAPLRPGLRRGARASAELLELPGARALALARATRL